MYNTSSHFTTITAKNNEEIINMFWDFDKNKIDINEINYDSASSVWWKCENNHSYKDQVRKVIKRGYCLKCKQESKLLKNKYPELMKEWNYQKNVKIDSNKITYGSEIKVWWKCNDCSHEWCASPNSRTGKKLTHCPKCAPTKWGIKQRKTQEEFEREVCDLVGNEYTVLGEYIGNNKPIKMKHNMCNHIWKVQPGHFLEGTRCPKCRIQERTKTTEQFKQEVFDLVHDEYEVIGEYIHTNKAISLKHNKCGKSYKTKPNIFLKGNRCPYCSASARKTQSKFEDEVSNLTGDEYSVLGSYINAQTKILMIHNLCGNEYYVTPNKFIDAGRRCPKCAESKGEQRIRHYLENHNIKFVPQYKYSDLLGTGGGLLSYDFYLPDYNCLIEYQGEQHEHFVKGFHQSIKDFEKQSEHDKRKREYAGQHGIVLLEIWYWDFENVEKILNDIVCSMGLI